MTGFLTEFDLPDKWLTAVAVGGVVACKGLRRGTAMVAGRAQYIA